MATNKYLFIDSQFVQDYSIIELNVESKYITASILNAQEDYIEPLLGSQLYRDIINQLSASTVSSDNQVLLDDYIKNCLAAYSVYKLGMGLSKKWTNSGVMITKTVEQEAASQKDLNQDRQELLDSASIRAERLTKFLLAHPNEYPLYFQNTSIDDVQPLLDNQGSSGIYFPNKFNTHRKIGFDKPL